MIWTFSAGVLAIRCSCRQKFPMGAEMPTKGKESTFGCVIYIHMNRLLPTTKTAEREIRPHII